MRTHGHRSPGSHAERTVPAHATSPIMSSGTNECICVHHAEKQPDQSGKREDRIFHCPCLIALVIDASLSCFANPIVSLSMWWDSG
jgi:hypothetical protein